MNLDDLNNAVNDAWGSWNSAIPTPPASQPDGVPGDATSPDQYSAPAPAAPPVDQTFGPMPDPTTWASDQQVQAQPQPTPQPVGVDPDWQPKHDNSDPLSNAG